ncbi:hypothetical protein BDF22DRAFT_702899 [Syncephalis plumigaleata]|nr:hypothetical protein BDF22DRAFT_702899 [Syncephalis plumigaleata]
MDKPSFRPISEESPPLESLETESPPSFFVCNDDPLTESRGRSLKFVVPTSSKTASSTTTTTTTTTVSGEAPSKAPSTADEGERTAIHMGDDHETSTLGDLSSILHEPIPEVVQDISLDGEVEIEEEVDEAVVAAAKIATVVAASPHRRRREVETPELYASVALVVQQQQEEARRTRLSISEPRGQIEAQFINRLQESINAANAASSVSPNTSAPQALLTSENDFDTVTSVLDSHARMSSSLPALNNMHRSLGSSMLRANSNEDKLTALLLQPSSLESLRKIVPAPETTLSRLSVVLAGDAPDEMSRQHVLRAFARALHTGGKGGSAIGNLDEYANIAQYGLHVTDVTGTTAQAQQQAAIRHSELCVYFLRPPVSKSQLDGAADCARQITILPVCLSQGERLYADQRLITRGLTQRKVANTVLTPGTTSTVMQLAEMHPATLAFSLQLAQERTVTERAANKRQRIRFILSMIMLFLTSLFILVILPGEGSTGRDALDAALPVAWSRWLARWSPFTGLSSSSSPSLQSTYPHYYDTVYYHEGTEDDDPHADWIYAPDNVIIEELPEYETLPPQSAKMEGGSNGKPTDEKKETEEEEEIPDDLFSWFASMTRRLSQYLKKEELPQKKGVVGMGVRTIVEWIDTLFGVEEEEHEEEKQATQADTTEEERQQQQRHRRRRRIRIRRTRHRTYELGMRGNLHWVMDVGLDAMDDARIWLFRTTEPLRRELLYQ